MADQSGTGAVFTIELPIGATAAGPASADAAPVPAVPPSTVLVVDDEPAVTALLADMLRLDGHRVDTAPNAVAALERLNEQTYDLVISDIRMPKLDGPHFFREVERRHARRRPPFVFITGDILSADTVRFLEAAKLPCLQKPFVAQDVRRTIHRALAGSG